MITQKDAGGENGGSVKVSIEISDSQQPVTFTCDGKQFFVTMNCRYKKLLTVKMVYMKTVMLKVKAV